MADTDLKLQHAGQFTNREIRTLTYWLQAVNDGRIGNAGAILSTGLEAEHYSSLLDDDQSKRTEDEMQILAGLEAEADAQIERLYPGSAGKLPGGYG